MVSAGIKWWDEGKTNDKAWLQVRLGIFNYLPMFATVRLTVRAPILGFCDEKNTTQSFGFALRQGYPEIRLAEWFGPTQQILC